MQCPPRKVTVVLVLACALLPSCTMLTTSGVETVRMDSGDNTLRRYHNEVIPRATDEELRHLITTDACASVVLAAAWERLLRTSYQREQADERDIGEAEIQRFLGVVEGKMRVELPEWWELGICSARVSNLEHRWVRFTIGAEADRSPFQLTHDHIRIAKGASLDRQGENWSIRHLDKSYPLPGELLRSAGGPVDVITFETADGAYIVGTHSSRATPYLVYGVDLTTWHTRWTAKVLSLRNSPQYTGRGWHWSELRADADVVFVFGMTDDTAYIEAFDVRTGVPLLRFWTK